MSVIDFQKASDKRLRDKYLQTMPYLGITDPATLARISAHLTPETVASCREDIKAIVYGEPGLLLR